MTTQPEAIERPRSRPVSWLVGLGTAAIAAAISCFRKLAGEKKILSRSQEKQRRKALIRKLNQK